MIFVSVANKISELLIKNYLKIRRDLPWRQTRDPYLLWISEVILQQTRVAQGLPYYLRFAERFPDVKSLASAQEDEVLRLWQGLGYYSRARNMHETAKEVVERFGGIFPSSYEELISLKGVGDYTASAVSSFASDEARAVVDGNVIRVLARIFGVEEPADTPAGKRFFKALAAEILDEQNPAIHNQAIMEFGALVCTPGNPGCGTCGLSHLCVAFRTGRVREFPLKRPKNKPRDRFFTYLHFTTEGYSWVHKRDDSEIWKGLYQFYLIETDSLPTEEQLYRLIMEETGRETAGLCTISPKVTHILSHQKLHIRFVRISSRPPSVLRVLKKIRNEELDRLAFPAVIVKYLDSFMNYG